ncbi:MAG: efflux RND transporter periplasmic adaptor subunit [Rubrimonas sp.]|uniref:efflux RND transporter periplasmic adaptor subunit n=1 Tax=Rubrimonas sp. TaxID=2036015 RepID=UPI002FDE7B30
MRDHLDDPEARTSQRRSGGLRRSALGVAFVVVVVGATAALVAALHQRAAGPGPGALAPPPLVEVVALRREPGHMARAVFTGRIEPWRQTALAFEQGGRIAEILVEEGDAVEKGAVVARLDTATLDAERLGRVAARDRLEAALRLAELSLERVDNLSTAAATAQRRDDARLGRDQARAALAEAEAALAALDVARGKAELRAPFAGIVAARRLDEGAVVEAGAPALDLLETGRAAARIGLSAEAAARLRVGDAVTLNHGDQTIAARLAALRPDIDPASRTLSALFEIGGDAPPFGAVVRLEATRWIEGDGVWAPVAALSDGGRGLWALTLLDESVDPPVAVRALAQVAAVEGERAFLTGALPDGARAIASGAHRVAPGQAVSPAPVPAPEN